MTTDDTTARGSSRFLDNLRNLGPGLLVAAAFLGPGTITTASTAGAANGFQLLWALIFGIAAAMVLQEMNARLGVVTREGLGEALRTTFDTAAMRRPPPCSSCRRSASAGAAFESGNITGAAIGLESVIPLPQQLWSVVVALIAGALLWSGTYRAIERVLIGLVIVMSVVFLVTAIMVRPDLGALFGGLVPTVPSGALLTVVALVGTTVVPYNFFLHASSVQEKWPQDVPTERALSGARFDTVASTRRGTTLHSHPRLPTTADTGNSGPPPPGRPPRPPGIADHPTTGHPTTGQRTHHRVRPRPATGTRTTPVLNDHDRAHHRPTAGGARTRSVARGVIQY